MYPEVRLNYQKLDAANKLQNRKFVMLKVKSTKALFGFLVLVAILGETIVLMKIIVFICWDLIKVILRLFLLKNAN